MRRLLGFVTPAGRALFSLGVASWLIVWGAGLVEFAVIGWLCVLLLGLALPFLLVPARTRGHIVLRPARTMAGETGQAELRVTNVGSWRIRRPLVELPVADRSITSRLADLRPGVAETARFPVPALRRGVLPVGPARALIHDPLGLFVRQSEWTGTVELLVRPRMIGVPSLGAGIAHDLEGAPSDQVSMSDLAFHALREYVRGDDLRHVHWRSSARAGRLHVRQYHDSRRSRATIVIDDDATAYPRKATFELALSIAASVLVQLQRDDFEVSLVCGPQHVLTGTRDDLLDATCRAVMRTPEEGADLVAAGAGFAELVGDPSLVIVVTGESGDAERARRIRAAYPSETGFLTIRTGRRLRRVAGEPAPEPVIFDPAVPDAVTIRALDELPGAISAARQGILT